MPHLSITAQQKGTKRKMAQVAGTVGRIPDGRKKRRIGKDNVIAAGAEIKRRGHTGVA